MRDFILSSIGSYKTILEHYDFVIADIESEIYNPAMNASKEPVLAFLRALRNAYGQSLADAERQLEQFGERS